MASSPSCHTQYVPRDMHMVYATGLTHAKLVFLTSPCCSGCPAPMNTPQGLRSIQLMTGEPRPRYSALQLLGVGGACGLCCVLAGWRSGLQRFASHCVCGSLVGLCSPVCERHLLGSGDNNNGLGLRVTPSRFIRLVILPVISFRII